MTNATQGHWLAATLQSCSANATVSSYPEGWGSYLLSGGGSFIGRHLGGSCFPMIVPVTNKNGLQRKCLFWGGKGHYSFLILLSAPRSSPLESTQFDISLSNYHINWSQETNFWDSAGDAASCSSHLAGCGQADSISQPRHLEQWPPLAPWAVPTAFRGVYWWEPLMAPMYVRGWQGNLEEQV